MASDPPPKVSEINNPTTTDINVTTDASPVTLDSPSSSTTINNPPSG